ncbi:AfsR/SARP family transcriptional regulator [Solihabitans fulvus]|nr:tetratricopeptide repeat protein [Solihabitans fulvus]
MQFRVLGPVEVSGVNGPAHLAGSRQLALLSTLLLHANRVVSVDQLTDAVWADAPPAHASAALQTYVFRLRRTLSAAEPGADQRIAFTSGYRLRVEPGELDLQEFRDHVQRARAAGDPAIAGEELRSALKLWRGPAYTGVASRPVRTQAARLDEERLAALEERIDADLTLGRHAELVAELHDLAAEHPLRERLRGNLMLALHRSGRHAEALQAFQDIRTALVEELGVDPGAELTELHRKILARDPELTNPRPAATAVRRNDLPRDIIDFTGREREMARLLAALPTDTTAGAAVVIEAIDGMAGVGKTTLAVHAAHQLADRYPDAQLFIDLHGHTPDHQATEPITALDALLRAVGVPGEKIPQDLDARSALWRAELAERRALVVLDNAANAAQIQPLLPGASGCLALITSRRRLADLDTTRTLSLDVLPSADALALFARIAGERRLADEPAAAAELVALCGYLPLAIRIAAARLRTRASWTAAHLVQRLREGQRRLTELTTGDRSVASAFTLSYEHLTAAQQRLFRLLGLVPGPDFDAYAAAALTGAGLAETDQLLEDLVDMHLLEQHAPGRYRFHDLLRQHANSTAVATDAETDRREAVTGLLDYYLYTTRLATGRFNPGAAVIAINLAHPPKHVPDLPDFDRANSWMEAEHAGLLAAVPYAADNGWLTHTWQLTKVLGHYAQRRGDLRPWIDNCTRGLAAARQLGDLTGQGEMHRQLGVAYRQSGQYAEAIDHSTQSLGYFRKLGDRLSEGNLLNNIALLHRVLGRYTEALEYFQLAIAVAEDIDDPLLLGFTLANLGTAYFRLGRHDEALDCQLRALAALRQVGHRQGEGHVLNDLGHIYRALGDQVRALDHVQRALALRHEFGDRWGVATTLTNLGNVERESGQYELAVQHHEQALAGIRELVDPGAECEMLNDLAETHGAAGDTERSRLAFEGALRLAQQVHDRYQEARAHNGIAGVLRLTDPVGASEHWRKSLIIYTELGVPQADEVRAHLETQQP